MNRRIICALLVTVLIFGSLSGCKKKVDNQDEELSVPQSSAPTIEIDLPPQPSEIPMSDELKDAIENGWIMEDWPEESIPVTPDVELTPPTQNDEEKDSAPTPTPSTAPVVTPTPTPSTAPAVTPTPNAPSLSGLAAEYKNYLAMSPEEQQNYFNSFDSIDAYFAWLNSAKKAYEDSLNAEELNGGSVDVEDILGNNKG